LGSLHKVRGYREATCWGEEHSVQEKTRYQDRAEFETFMREEIEYKDAAIYWGEKY